MKYICNFCEYETDRHFSYQKHLTTKKHAEKENELAYASRMHPVSISKIHKCLYCNTLFANAGNLARHKKSCSEKEVLRTNHDKEIEDYKKENAYLKELHEKELEHIKILNKQQQDEINHLKSLITNAGAVIKTSVSALSYVVQHYDKAPTLKQLKDYSFLQSIDEDSDDEFDLTQTIINNHIDKKLDSYVGDIIIGSYKKKDPTKQSLWNSDSVRLTYVIRELINKKPDWTVDKKGVKTTKYIIEPLLEYIRELMEIFFENNKLEDYLGDSIVRMKRRIDNLEKASEICFNIKNNTLSEQILKYIAPYFYLPKNDQLIED